MELTPRLYHWVVRPRYVTNFYVNNIIKSNFNLSNKTALDFGCGIGSSCCLFCSSNYLGIDPDSKRIAYAKQLYPKYNFRVLKDKLLPLACNSLDYIMMIAVLHHMESDEIQVYLQQFRQLLNPYGKIIVMEPCILESSRFNNWFMEFFDNGKYIRTEKSYISLFKCNKYQVEVIKKYRRLFYNEILFVASV